MERFHSPSTGFTVRQHGVAEENTLPVLYQPAVLGAPSKGISVLRIGWPDFMPSARTATASRVELLLDEVDDEAFLSLNSTENGGDNT